MGRVIRDVTMNNYLKPFYGRMFSFEGRIAKFSIGYDYPTMLLEDIKMKVESARYVLDPVWVNIGNRIPKDLQIGARISFNAWIDEYEMGCHCTEIGLKNISAIKILANGNGQKYEDFLAERKSI